MNIEEAAAKLIEHTERTSIITLEGATEFIESLGGSSRTMRALDPGVQQSTYLLALFARYLESKK